MTARHQTVTLRAASALLLAATLLPATALAAPDATGIWLNDTGRGAIEIKPCGSSLCGHVVWVKDGSDAKGCGRQIIGDAQPARTGTWDNGWIYSPERKKRYNVELKPLDNDRLRVTGYAGSRFFSKTMIWKRAPADLVRCSSVEAKAPATSDKTADVASAAPVSAAPEKSTAADGAPAATKPNPTAQPESLSPEAKLREQLKEPEPATASGTEGDTAEETTETADAGGLDLGELKLDKYLKRKNGKCDLDLPWVKVSFECEK